MVNKLCQDINQIVSEWPKPRLHFVPLKSDSMAPKIRFCSEIFFYTEQYHSLLRKFSGYAFWFHCNFHCALSKERLRFNYSRLSINVV